MAQHTPRWPAAAAVIALVGLVGVVTVSGGSDSGWDLPRLRVSVPGLDHDVDLFVDESDPVGDDTPLSEVIEINGIDQFRAVFDADRGRPRHVVWAPVLGGDLDRTRQATATINGSNVTHYWDPDAVVGFWARDHLPWPSNHGPAWDVFYLFDRDATWTDRPASVRATGYNLLRSWG